MLRMTASWPYLLLATCFSLPALGARHISSVPTVPVALCLSVKDQQFLHLLEWLDYHLAIGVNRVYLWDNNSSLPLAQLLADYIQREQVQYHHFSTTEGPQMLAYQQCHRLYGNTTEWLGFIDVDEFINIPSGKPLAEILAPYKEHGALAMNYRTFGSSGHIRRPAGAVLNNYWRCFPGNHTNNKHVKSFIVPSRAERPADAHHWKLKAPYHAVNARGDQVEGPFSLPADFSTIWVAHYAILSRQDFEAKMARGSGQGGGAGKKEDFWATTERFSTENCTALLKWPAMEQPAQLSGTVMRSRPVEGQ